MLQIAIAANKGGVGKTTLAVHLAAGLARRGRRALLVDLDGQGHATKWLCKTVEHGATSEAALIEGRVAALARCDERENLFALQATDGLNIADAALAPKLGWHRLLRRAVEAHASKIDVVVYDCPPALGHVVAAALYASDCVIVPVSPAYLSLDGVEQLHTKLALVREMLDGRTRVLGHVIFGADKRDSRTSAARDVLRERYPGGVFESEIRFSSAGPSLPALGALAWEKVAAGRKRKDLADARGAQDYEAFISETIEKLQSQKEEVA